MSSIGQAAGGIVGGIVGFMVGGPVGFKYGAQIGIMAGGYLDPPDGPVTRGPRLEDLSVQTSTYGAPIPRVYGTVPISGNLFWLLNDELTEVKKRREQGGKGGGSTGTSVTYAYYATFAVGLCKGPIAGVRRIWIGPDLYYDAGSSDPETVFASNEAAGTFTVYLGTDTQDPDPLIQADRGAANVPAYRGLAYIVFDNLPLEKWGNSLAQAQVRAEVVGLGSAANQVLDLGTRDTEVTGGEGNWDQFISFMAEDHVWMGERVYHISGKLLSENLPATVNSLVRRSCAGYYCGFADSGAAVEGEVRKVKRNTGYGELLHTDSVRDAYQVVCPNSSGHGWPLYVAKHLPAGSSYNSRVTRINEDGSELDCDISNIDARGVQVKNVSGIHLVYTIGQSRGYGSVLVIDGSSMSVADTVAFPASGAGGPMSSHAFVYNDDQDVLVGACTRWWYVIDCSDHTVLENHVYSSALDGEYYSGSRPCYDKTRHRIWFWYTTPAPNQLWYIDCAAGTLHQDTAFPSGHAATGAYMAVDANGNIWMRSNFEDYLYYPDGNLLTLTNATLGDIVEDECLTTGLLEAADIDVTDLTDEVRGFRVAGPDAIRAGLDVLRAAWPFDVRQHGYQIEFVRRGGASVDTIQASALGAHAYGDQPGPQVVDTREMDIVLPQKVSVKYLDSVREYDVNEQHAQRANTDAVNHRVLDLSIPMNAQEAKRTAAMLLYQYWLDRYDVSFVLPPSYQHLEPCDPITVTADNVTYSLRLTSVNYLPDGRVECSARYASAAIYSQESVSDEGGSTGGGLGIQGPTIYQLLDIPLLLDDYDKPGFPVAMCGMLSAWDGGVLYRSDDSGETWTAVMSGTTGSTIGYATDTLSEHGGTVIDFSGVLTVRLYNGTLSSVTDAAMFAGSNWFAYGADGRWEIIAARNAVLQADGSYVLTDFLRGQRGTEWATGLHEQGDAIVLLETSTLDFLSVNSSTIGVERSYRGITMGEDISSTSDDEFTYAGVNLECLSPVHLTGSRHPTTRDWTISWTRRSRFGAWRDYIDAPLGESSESYTAEVYSDSAFTTLVRSISSTTQSFTYTSAQQVDDFGSDQGTLYLKIYQNSATVGAGYAASATLTRA